jgi:integrase
MGAYKRKLSKGVRWFYRGQYLNNKYHSKAIYLTKAECLKAERKHLKKIDERERKGTEDILLEDLILLRLDQIQSKMSNDYYKENKRYFRKILDEWGNVYISTITKQMVNSLFLKEVRRLKKAGKTNHKANSMLRCLKALFNYAIKNDYDVKNPCNISLFPIDIKLKHIPTDKEIENVKAMCTPEQVRLVEFVEETGCRIMEAIKLDYADIDNDLVTLYTRKSKNSNLVPRRIPRPHCLGEENYKGGKVFRWENYPRFLEPVMKKLGYNWNWHSLRHRRASIWANSGMNIYEIMVRLGHNNMSTTMKYLQLLGFTDFSR